MKIRLNKPVTKKQPEQEPLTLNYSNRIKIPKIERPKFADTLTFPADKLTAMTAEAVSDLHAKYTLMFSYVNQEAGRVNMEILDNQSKESRTRIKIFLSRPTINAQERWRRDAIMEADPAIVSLNTDLVLLKMEKEYFERLIQNYEKYLFAISRELTRKSADKNSYGN